MKTIWKYQFNIEGGFELEMPVGAEILAVQMQQVRPCIWALVDTTAPKEFRKFLLYGTNHGILSSTGRYVGAVQTDGGTYVWHIFEGA